MFVLSLCDFIYKQLVLCDVTHFDTYMYINMYIFQYIYTYDMLKTKQTYKSRFRNSGKLTSFLGWGGWGWLSRLGPRCPEN